MKEKQSLLTIQIYLFLALGKDSYFNLWVFQELTEAGAHSHKSPEQGLLNRSSKHNNNLAPDFHSKVCYEYS